MISNVNNKQLVQLIKIVAFIVILSSVISVSVIAGSKDFYPGADSYDFEESSDYNYSGSTSTTNHLYGDPIGKIKISGDIEKETTFRGNKAYCVNGNISISYEYDGAYQDNDSADWNLESDSEKSAAGYKFDSKIGKGVLIIEKSKDGQTWNKSAEYTNFFENNKTGINDLLKTSDNEIIGGTYYRITVAYKMQRQTGKFWGFLWPEYEHKKFADVYTFYVLKDSNPVVIKDIITHTAVPSSNSVNYGFIIDKSGSTCKVDVKKDGKIHSGIKDGASFFDPGTYNIDITTNFGTKYTTSIKVVSGLKMKKLNADVYETDSDYSNQLSLNRSNTVFGALSLTNLYMTQNNGAEIRFFKDSDKVDSYGINGDGFWIFAYLNYGLNLKSNGWSINTDQYGKYEGETIEEVVTGQVGSGAFIIQTSKDGINWEDADKDKYAKGLYTTDFCNNYASESDILLYMPSGHDIINGIYIRIMFAYEVINGTETKNYIEKYEFYLCNENLNAITLHNKSVEQDFSKMFTDEDKNTVEMYKYAETLLNNTLTVTGFRLDNSKNPTVSCEVYRNDELITGNKTDFSETGKYDIYLKSKVGTQNHITVYIDQESTEKAFERYFGISLITEDSKRIYRPELDYPTFEGGKTYYHINSVSDEFLPVSGAIKNLSRDGVEIQIDPSRTEKKGIITVPGEYVAELRVNPSFATGNPCGDDIIFTFHFFVIAEGTAPGPRANQESLAEYSHTNISDAKPIYYGVTYSSAASGNITIAFATREEAVKFAAEYEQGVVEKQSDGSFRYTGSMAVSQKQRINSSWDLADAINYFANLAVQELYFDLSDEFTYTSLRDEDIQKVENLRTLELQESIVVFGNNQKKQITGYNKLPILSPKPQRFLSLDKNSDTVITYGDFKFVKDKLGIDSDKVVIIDCNGKEYKIEYMKDVGAQLEAHDCPSGVITIREYTKYGDIAEYKAVFVKKFEVQTKVEIKYYIKEDEKKTSIDPQLSNEPIYLDAFSIEKISDVLDDYPLVVIMLEGTPIKAYTSDSDFSELFTKPGNYTIKCVNRLGYYYEIPVVVNSDTGYSISVSFTGDGTENEKPIIVYPGQTNVNLPEIERYGYILEGFKTSDGTVYSGEIEKILSKSDIILEALWQAKQYRIRFVDEDNRLLEERTVSFGDSIELPVPTFDNQASFVSWSVGDEVITENTYVVLKEGDIIFKAVTKDGYSATTDNRTETQNDADYKLIIIISVAAVSLVIVITVIILAVKKAHKHNAKKDEEDEENGEEQH